MKVTLNRNEGVTVILRSSGGGQISIRAYAKRSPGAVVNEAFSRFDRRTRLVLMERLEGLLWSPREFRQTIHWLGSPAGDLTEEYDRQSAM